ncbi:methyltransferase family protein [Pseudoxanthomonas dokdonensis]|uniref:Isoprenylcysteine carboxyl methyltransferase n=1 Tax=Pseudoxanthomonas dokdonensis TaxID=344882 RepID=A0A0R0CK04_9GAMM|nr:isoprenylcysteine carboxylmethyltransferase family protein [Pseudoxanthomonas dokdonensis]KRG69851.1 hypothetical protein ABB29_08275 [Pseudoxanthomonas dokdonensis]
MTHGFNVALKLTWASVCLYWMWSARGNKPVERSEPSLQRFLYYWLPLLAVVALLGPGEWFGDSWLRDAFLPHSLTVEAVGLLLCVAGAVLAIWSRWSLGRNWSVSVQIKQAHALVENGPYRRVRHPIYSALLLMFTGTAIMIGEWRGLIALALALASFWFKLRREEHWLLSLFGERYRDYIGRTGALLPRLP